MSVVPAVAVPFPVTVDVIVMVEVEGFGPAVVVIVVVYPADVTVVPGSVSVMRDMAGPNRGAPDAPPEAVTVDVNVALRVANETTV